MMARRGRKFLDGGAKIRPALSRFPTTISSDQVSELLLGFGSSSVLWKRGDASVVIEFHLELLEMRRVSTPPILHILLSL